jgi:hypothetical protein
MKQVRRLAPPSDDLAVGLFGFQSAVHQVSAFSAQVLAHGATCTGVKAAMMPRHLQPLHTGFILVALITWF